MIRGPLHHRAVGVVIPAHNEAELIGRCLDAVDVAVAHTRDHGVAVHVIVVCDACNDRTAEIARGRATQVIEIDARNVGLARSVGADAALALGAEWLAFTDADTRVSREWLSTHLAIDCSALCGTIAVDDWAGHDAATRLDFETTYTDADGHRHVHGANLGISAEAYRRVGGFTALRSSEDVALIDAVIAAGGEVAWSAAPRVLTSARLDFRAPGGFGATLARVAARSEVALSP